MLRNGCYLESHHASRTSTMAPALTVYRRVAQRCTNNVISQAGCLLPNDNAGTESLIPAVTTAKKYINSTRPIRLWVVSTTSQSRGLRRTRPRYSSSHWPTPHAQPKFKIAATPHQIRPTTMPTCPSQHQSPGAPHNSPHARRQAQHHGQNHSPNACLTSGSAY